MVIGDSIVRMDYIIVLKAAEKRYQYDILAQASLR